MAGRAPRPSRRAKRGGHGDEPDLNLDVKYKHGGAGLLRPASKALAPGTGLSPEARHLRYTISPPMPKHSHDSKEHDPNHLLTDLEAAKSRFHSNHAAQIAKLLTQLSKLQLTDPQQLIRFHEALLFLRAFPHAPSLVPRVDHLLNTFHARIERLRAAGADMSVFDDFDTSGIAGTTMQDTLSFDVAHWLVRRIPQNVEIAWDDYWDDYQAERARGTHLAAFYSASRRRCRRRSQHPMAAIGSTPPEAAKTHFPGSSTASRKSIFPHTDAPNSTIHFVYRSAGNSTT